MVSTLTAESVALSPTVILYFCKPWICTGPQTVIVGYYHHLVFFKWLLQCETEYKKFKRKVPMESKWAILSNGTILGDFDTHFHSLKISWKSSDDNYYPTITTCNVVLLYRATSSYRRAIIIVRRFSYDFFNEKLSIKVHMNDIMWKEN